MKKVTCLSEIHKNKNKHPYIKMGHFEIFVTNVLKRPIFYVWFRPALSCLWDIEHFCRKKN